MEKIKLKVGNIYEARNGKTIEIIEHLQDFKNVDFPYRGITKYKDSLFYYTEDGIVYTGFNRDSEWDLMSDLTAMFERDPDNVVSVNDDNERVNIDSNDHPFIISVKHGGKLTNVTLVPIGEKLHVLMSGGA